MLATIEDEPALGRPQADRPAPEQQLDRVLAVPSGVAEAQRVGGELTGRRTPFESGGRSYGASASAQTIRIGAS